MDLFAGAGGATEGLKQAGFRVVGAVEIDEDACVTYVLNHPDVALERGDIHKLDPLDLLARWELRSAELTLLKACPPCQSFSTLGTANADDPRNDLVLDVWRFINAFRPRAFVLENVPGIRSDRRLAHLSQNARKAGFAVRAYNLDAADFGVPQRRRRHVVIGVLGAGELPDDLFALLVGTFDCSPETAGAALRTARRTPAKDPLRRGRSLRPATLARITAIPVGGNRFDLPANLRLPCHERLDASGRGRNATGPYGRIKADAPAPTMTTRCTTPACGSFVHPRENRGITLREAAVLQTFPLSYQFAGGYDSIERQVGNAVPVRLACALGVVVNHLTADVLDA